MDGVVMAQQTAIVAWRSRARVARSRWGWVSVKQFLVKDDFDERLAKRETLREIA